MTKKEAGESGVKLSVVIACLNEEEMIGGQLEALSSQHWPESWEVVVADNGSTDRTLEVIERYRERLPRLKVVDASDEKGQPYALNRGVEAARGEALAFCDADDEVGEGWVEAMGEALKEHDFVAGPWEVQKLNPPWLAASRKNPQPDGLQHKNYLPFASSGNMGIRRLVFEAVGGFDESVLYIFDVDFCWRVQQETGVELVFVPEAVMHVRYRRSLLGMYRQACNYSVYKNQLLERYGVREPRGPVSWQGLWSLFRVTVGKLRRVRSRSDLYRWAWRLGWHVGEIKRRSLPWPLQQSVLAHDPKERF